MSRTIEIAEAVHAAFRRAGFRPPYRVLPRWHLLAILRAVDEAAYGLLSSQDEATQRDVVSELRSCDLLSRALLARTEGETR